MKNYLLLFALCVFAVHTHAQTMEDMFPKTATYFIKGGKQIPYNKLDSVIMAWGGAFNKEETGDKIYLSPSTAADRKAIEDLKAGANASLNKPAKDFILTDVTGKSCSLAALRGKIVVVNFWFTTCVACIAEMPELNKLKKSYADKNVVFLALGRDDAEATTGFLKKHQFDYTLLTNATKTAVDYGVSLYPTSMVIDQKGLVRFVQVTGEGIEENMKNAIDVLL